MNRQNTENLLLLTDELVEVHDMRKTTDLLRGIQQIYLKSIKPKIGKCRDVTA